MKRNLLLFLVVLLSLVLYFAPEQKPDIGSDAKESSVNLVSAECLSSLNRIRFVHAGASQELVLSESIKSDDVLIRRSKWLLKEPYLAPADEEKVEVFITSLGSLKGVSSQSSPKAERQGELGLTPPDGVLILECGAVKEVLSIGTKSEISKNRYYQKEGRDFLYLVEDNFFDSTVELFKDIRAKKILAFNYLDIQGLEVVDGDNYYSLERSEKGEWSVSTEGRKFKGDKAFIEKELKDLVSLSISRRFDNPLEVLPFTGLEQPKLILNLKINLGEDARHHELVLQFGRGILGDLLAKKQEHLPDEAKESYYLKITKENFIYELERSYIADWLQGANHFRDRKPFDGIDPANIKSASLKVDNLSCGLDNGFFVKNPEMLRLFKKALGEMSFDAFFNAEELSAYPVAGGLSAQLQVNNEIISIAKINDVVNEIEAKHAVVASIWEISEIGKDSYYGSMIVDRVSSIQGIFKELCLQRGGGEGTN